MSRNRVRIVDACWLVLATCLACSYLPDFARAATASELLEKGIYEEETVGNLDAAIRVYEEVIAAGKSARNAAAEAQFRIGVCYAKQGKDNLAAEAFQKVIDEFPNAKEAVAQARSRLSVEPELLSAPWKDGEELHLEMKLPNGSGIGNQIYRIAKFEKDGRDLWECTSWQTVTLNGMKGKSRVLVEPEGFSPIESDWKHSLLGEAHATYGKDKVVIELANKEKPAELDITEPTYDNEQGAELFRLLPLKDGFKTKLNIVAPLTATKVPLGLEVTGIETVEVPAGKFECFRLDLDINQTFWISTDAHRYIVQFEAGGVVAHLKEVRHRQADESTQLDREEFSATLPPNWHAYTPLQTDDDGKTTTFLIDPEASVLAKVEIGPLKSIESKVGTPQGWLELALEGARKRYKNVKLADEGYETIKVGDREGSSMICTHDHGDVAQTSWRVAIFGDAAAARIRFTTPTDDFAKWQPAAQEIVASLRVQ